MFIRSIIAATAASLLLSSTASATLVGGADTIDPVTVHAGTVAIGPTLTYVSGSNGSTGTADGTTYATTFEGSASALASADHHWAQYDPGIYFSSGSAVQALIAIPAIDHGWTSDNTDEFYEPFEFRIFGCTAIGSCLDAGVITDVWTRGVDDVGAMKNADDFTTRWAFGGSYSLFLMVSGDRLVGGPYSPGEGEIDALAVETPEPSTLALIGILALSLFGFGVMRRRADA
jgi:hypothetical protein